MPAQDGAYGLAGATTLQYLVPVLGLCLQKYSMQGLIPTPGRMLPAAALHFSGWMGGDMCEPLALCFPVLPMSCALLGLYSAMHNRDQTGRGLWLLLQSQQCCRRERQATPPGT